MSHSTWQVHEPSRGLTRRSVLLGGAASAAVVSLGLSACSAGQQSTNKAGGPAVSFGPPQGGTPRQGGDLTVAMITGGAGETINVFSAFNVMDIMRVYSLYDLLFIPAAGGKVLPGLCTTATPNANASQWTLELRKGVTWHDGKPFTADDVVYTIKNSWGNSKNGFYAVLSTLVDFAGVRKVGTHTVHVPLKQGMAEFPSVTCTAQCVVVQAGTTNFANGLGTGPYKLQSFKAGSRSTFVTNSDYWNGAAHIDRLIIDSSFSEDQARVNALLAGQADILPGVAPVLAAANAKGGKLVLGNQPGPGFVAIQMRVDQGGALGDARVRKALKLLPDRPQYVEVAYQGFGSVTNDCVGYTDQYFANDLTSKQDIAQAKSLLSAAGYGGLSVELQTAPAVPGMVETATLFKQHAKQAGVNVKVAQKSAADYYTSAGGYLTRSFSTINYTTNINSLSAFYVSSMLNGSPFSDTHWAGPGAPAFGKNNKLLLDAMAEVDQAKAQEKWHAVQVQMSEVGPYVIPATSNWVDAYSTRVRGVKTTSVLNCDNFNFSKAWLAS